MKFTYTGPETAVELFKIVFPRDMAVEVADPHAIAKLKNHPQFKETAHTLSLPAAADKKAK